jgi:hypothetical protein
MAGSPNTLFRSFDFEFERQEVVQSVVTINSMCRHGKFLLATSCSEEAA